jgi:tetratricopeptide (TPR) repeat protein
LSKELTAGPHRVGGNLSDWAHLYLDIGRLDLAEEKLRQALGIYEKTLETNDPEFALVLDNLAIVYNAQGEPERAIPYHLRGLSIRERTLAPDDPGVAESLHNTAKTYYDHGDYAVAENYFQRALDIFKEKRGLDHPSTIRGIEGLGLVYLAQGEPSKAESHYLRELKAYENALGPNHLYVAEVLDLYSAFLTQMNRYGEAQKIAARAEQIRDEST